MRSNRIPKTGPTPELTRLKQLPMEQREQIVEWKQTMTSEAVRGEIHERFGITLSQDSQLSKFLRWQRGQNAIGAFGEMAEAAEEGLLKRMSAEAARQTVIKWTYQQAALLEDPKLALEAVDRSQREDASQRDWTKLRDAMKTNIDRALEEFASFLKGQPELLAEFEALQAKVQAAMK